MARAHTTDTVPSNPGVRFERGDIDLSTVVWAGVAMSAAAVALSVATIWFGRALTRSEDRRKETTLPPAAVDRERLPPEPRLEALEENPEARQDRGQSKSKREPRPGYKLLPPRATSYFESQRETLEKGNRKEGILPIEDALSQLAGRLPARKREAPSGYAVPLPSKAASGRVETGEK